MRAGWIFPQILIFRVSKVQLAGMRVLRITRPDMLNSAKEAQQLLHSDEFPLVQPQAVQRPGTSMPHPGYPTRPDLGPEIFTFRDGYESLPG